MMIAAKSLIEAGYHTCVFSDEHQALKSLFPDYEFLPYPGLDAIREIDFVIVQNDNSKRSWSLLNARPDNCHFIFPKWNKRLSKWTYNNDYLCNDSSPLAQHITNACSKWLNRKTSKSVIINWLDKNQYRTKKRRVAIHPTSRNRLKQWSKNQFKTLAGQLQEQGFSPAFIVAEDERAEWKDIGFDVPHLSDLPNVANYIHESGYFIGNDSGLGHLASMVGTPTLTISDNPKQIKRWRPSWQTGLVVASQVPIPNFKGIGIRWRDLYWQRFVSPNRVLKAFKKLTKAMP